MFDIVKTNEARTMVSGLQKLEKHYAKFFPKTEIVVFYKKNKFHILSNGKLKESLHVSSLDNIFHKKNA